MMKPSTTLYWKELKNNSRFFIIVLALQLMILLFQLDFSITNIIFNKSLDRYNVIPISNMLLFGTFFSFPFMMLYSWHREEKEKTNYQILSLPVRSHVIIRNKVKAFLSIGMIWIIIFTANGFVRQLGRFLQPHFPYIKQFALYLKHFDLYLLIFYFRYFSNLILLLGFTCLVMGIVQMVRHRRLLIGTGFILIGSVLYIWTLTLYRSFLTKLLNRNLHAFTQNHRQLAPLLVNMADSFFPLLLGIACMYIGFYLFEKYGEV